MELDSGKQKVIFDILLNIIAATLPIAMLQLIVYPQIAALLGGNEYGFMLTIYSIWIIIPNSLGIVLNNIKLLKLPDYQKLGIEGDIPVLLRQWCIVSSLVVFVVIWFYCGNFNLTHIIIGSIIAILIFLKAYLEVGFRIKLNFVSILINSTLLSVGFLVGYLIFCLTNVWEFIYLFGYFFSSIYCALKTDLLKEQPKRTPLYDGVKKDAYSLVFSAFIINLTNYADKLVLYPLMGGMAVSIYYTSTILGKITGMLTGPINSVVLSYIARWDKSKAKVFSKVLLLGTIVCVIGYIVTVLFARPVIGFLFPQWLEPVMEIIPLTTVTTMLTVLISFLNPFILKFCKMQWQVGINMVGAIAYFGSALVLWYFMGLKGFCIGTIIGALAKLIIMIAVYYKSQ